MYSLYAAIRKFLFRVRRRFGLKKTFVPFHAPERLKKLFAYADISFLDIGARRGPLMEFGLFAPYAKLILCEPDLKEAQRLEHAMKQDGSWRKVTVIAQALHPAQPRVILNITKEPGLSSLLEPNLSLLSKFYSSKNDRKHTLDDWQIADRMEVPAITLDEAARRYDFSDLTLVKVDTQGTELDILRSGSSIVLPSVMGIYVEAEFMPLYQGQSLFGDLHQFLQSQGFRLIDIKRSLLRRIFSDRPVYSKRELAWSHALYLRETNSDHSSLTVRQKIKLACVCAHFEFFDYAVSLLQENDVVLFLREQGIGGVEDDIRQYAAYLWAQIRTGCNAREEQTLLSDTWTDRAHER